jgi:hypothetical protein
VVGADQASSSRDRGRDRDSVGGGGGRDHRGADGRRFAPRSYLYPLGPGRRGREFVQRTGEQRVIGAWPPDLAEDRSADAFGDGSRGHAQPEPVGGTGHAQALSFDLGIRVFLGISVVLSVAVFVAVLVTVLVTGSGHSGGRAGQAGAHIRQR